MNRPDKGKQRSQVKRRFQRFLSVLISGPKGTKRAHGKIAKGEFLSTTIRGVRFHLCLGSKCKTVERRPNTVQKKTPINSSPSLATNEEPIDSDSDHEETDGYKKGIVGRLNGGKP